MAFLSGALLIIFGICVLLIALEGYGFSVKGMIVLFASFVFWGWGAAILRSVIYP